MNFFKRFFGKTEQEEREDSDAFKVSFPKFNYELEFLEALDKTPTNKLLGYNPYWEPRFKELLGELKPILNKFLSTGLIDISLKEEVLKVPELKKILKENNLPQTGNKEILAKRVFDEVEDKSYAIHLIPFYKLTPKGKEGIKNYRDEFLKQSLNFLKHQAELLFENNLSELESNHFYIRGQHPDQRSLFGQMDSFGDRTKLVLKKLIQYESFRIQCKFPIEFEKKLRVLIGFRKMIIPFFEEFKNEYLKEIDLKEIYSILKTNPENFDFGEKDDFLNTLIHFEHQHFWNQAKLEEILDFKRRRPDCKFEGIQIINSGCKCHEEFGEEKYTWDKLDHLPKLPRFTKCICIYNLM